jgi:antitoxin component of MazEF toxin-antitoxin module
MVKTVTKIGNSKGIILDAALLELAHLKEGDQLAVTVHAGGTITLTPLEGRAIGDEVFDRVAETVLESYSGTLKKLS